MADIGRVLGSEKRLSFLVPKQKPNYDTQDITVILYRILMELVKIEFFTVCRRSKTPSPRLWKQSVSSKEW